MKFGLRIWKMFTHSIRWRLQLWLAFLLVCVLSGFGVTVYQLHRVQQFNQIDGELERRVGSLSSALRAGPPPGFGLARQPFETERRDKTGSPPNQDPAFRARAENPGAERESAKSPGRPGSRAGSGPATLDAGPIHHFADESKHPPLPAGRPDSPPFGGREIRPGPRDFGPRDFQLSPEAASLFDQAQTNTFYFTVWSRDGALLKRSTNCPPEVPLPERPGRDTRTHTRMRAAWREAFHFTELGDCVLAGRSIVADLNALRGFTGWLLAVGATVLAFGLGGGWWLTTRAIRPVEEISAAASRISAGNLSERIRVADPKNELGRLAGVLNSTFARLEAAFAQQKQFTADASHELRTPLAVIISEAQTALARARSPSEYRETVEVCLDTAQQMRRLTESLLELARFDAGREQSQRDLLDLAEASRACLERIRPLALEHGLRIHCELAPAKTLGHADLVGQVITNLLNNAIHYNKPNGEIRVNTGSKNGFAILTIADTGQGIAAEDLPHIFERFHRADKSRSRADGRFGLGLAICKAIVEAAGGRIEVVSQPGDGTTFTVRLPARSSQDQ